MKNLTLNTNPEVERLIKEYPEQVQRKILNLRRLIIEAARETDEVDNLEETLKWGEPSYLTKYGSTIRIDWKRNKPDQYAMYFKCTSKLVPTFKIVYNDVFNFEGDRAIIFRMNDEIPKTQLKKCITAGLNYHRVKTLPMLGLG
jgi:hypothetical protein